MGFAHWRDRHRWLRALGVSTAAIVLIGLWAHFTANCWLYLQTPAGAAITAGLWWSLLMLLGMMTWKGRFGFLALSVFGYVFLMPTVCGSRVPIVEANAIGALRTMATAVEYAKNHSPNRAYPRALPGPEVLTINPEVERYYDLEYRIEGSTGPGSRDGFVVRAVPKRFNCGVTRTFTVRSDGKLYYRQGAEPERLVP